MINFLLSPDGSYTARIGSFAISIGDSRFDTAEFAAVDCPPCATSHSVQPLGCGHSCICGGDDERIEVFESIAGESPLDVNVNRFRELVLKGLTVRGAARNWPPAAKQFARVDWKVGCKIFTVPQSVSDLLAAEPDPSAQLALFN